LLAGVSPVTVVGGAAFGPDGETTLSLNIEEHNNEQFTRCPPETKPVNSGATRQICSLPDTNRHPEGAFRGIMAENGKPWQNPEPQLSPKQRRALEALLAAPSIVAAAAQAGCAERSIRNWLQDEAFKRAFVELRRSLMDAAVLDLQRAYGRAAEVLIALLNDEDPRVQLRAVELLMNRVDKWVETEDIETRIAKLEDLLEQQYESTGRQTYQNGAHRTPPRG
jgi:hypothetical protein